MCPDCAESRGVPKHVTVGGGTRTIRYLCPACGREWDVQGEMPREQFA